MPYKRDGKWWNHCGYATGGLFGGEGPSHV